MQTFPIHSAYRITTRHGLLKFLFIHVIFNVKISEALERDRENKGMGGEVIISNTQVIFSHYIECCRHKVTQLHILKVSHTLKAICFTENSAFRTCMYVKN